jgi:hypothetical protein
MSQRMNFPACWILATALLLSAGAHDGATAGTPLLCSPGTFSPTGSEPCDPCPAGFYTPAAGFSSCLPCEAGTAQPQPGKNSCDPCLPGTFNPTTGQSTCTDCSPGFYQDASQAITCKPCDLGYATEQYGAQSCDRCLEGTFADQTGLSTCKDCPAGLFADTQGLSTCELCNVGTFSDEPGFSICNDCLPGYFADQKGATICNACPRGKFADQQGLSTCLDCDEGTFADVTGLSTCEKCAPGTYADAPGFSTCLDCDAGTFADLAGFSTCLDCPRGSFADAPGFTTCELCPAGRFAAATGRTTCLDCPYGRYADSPGASTCPTCDPGTFADEQGLSTCRDCAPGTFADLPGFSTCLDCNAGFFADAPGSSTCLACQPGSFADAPGFSTCEKCAAGEFVDVAAATRCERCAAGKYRVEQVGGNQCVDCPSFGAICNDGAIIAEAGFWRYVSSDETLVVELEEGAVTKRGTTPIDIYVTDIGDGGFRIVTDSAAGSPSSPIRTRFLVARPTLPARATAAQVELTLDGAPVLDCTGPADPAPCIEQRSDLADSIGLAARSLASGEWTLSVPALCAPYPVPGCERAAKDPSLLIKDGTGDKDAVGWKWPKGNEDATDLGDPTSSEHHAVCLYDATGDLLYRARVVASDDCGAKPCWKAKPGDVGELKDVFIFQDKEALADGTTQLLLKADGRERKTLGLKAKGASIELPSIPLALPLVLPVTVQLQSSSGACWESVFDATGTKKNTDTTFKAKGF